MAGFQPEDFVKTEFVNPEDFAPDEIVDAEPPNEGMEPAEESEE